MITIQVNQAVNDIRRLSRNLTPRELRAASSRAINHSLQKSQTQAKRELTKVFNISAGHFAAGIKVQRSTGSKLEGSLDGSRASFPIHIFSPKFETSKSVIQNTKPKRVPGSKKGYKSVQKVTERKKPKSNPNKGVTFEIFKGEQRTLPFAFMIPGKYPVFARGTYNSSGGNQFIKRTKREVPYPKSDTPIAKLITVSPYTAVVNDKILPPLADKTGIDYQQRIVHEIAFIVSKR